MGVAFWPLDETLVYMMHGDNGLNVARFGTRELKEQQFVLSEACVLEIHSFRTREFADTATSPVDASERAYPSMELRSMTREELSKFGFVGSSIQAKTVIDPYFYLMMGGYEIQSKCGVGSASSSSSPWYLHWVKPLLESDRGTHFLRLNDATFFPSRQRYVGGRRSLLSEDSNDELKHLLSRLKDIDDESAARSNDVARSNDAARSNDEARSYDAARSKDTDRSMIDVPIEISELLQYGSYDDSESDVLDVLKENEEDAEYFLTRQHLGTHKSRPTTQEIASTYALPSASYDKMSVVYRKDRSRWLSVSRLTKRVRELSGDVEVCISSEKSSCIWASSRDLGVLKQWDGDDLLRALRRRQNADETSRTVNVLIRDSTTRTFLMCEVQYPDNDAFTRDGYVVRVLESSSLRSVSLRDMMHVESLDRYVSKYHVLARRVSFSERISFETISRAQRCVADVHGGDPELSALWLLDITLKSWTETCRLNTFEPSLLRLGMRREMLSLESFRRCGFTILSGDEDVDEIDHVSMILNSLGDQGSIRNPFDIQLSIQLFDHLSSNLRMISYRGGVLWMRN